MRYGDQVVVEVLAGDHRHQGVGGVAGRGGRRLLHQGRQLFAVHSASRKPSRDAEGIDQSLLSLLTGAHSSHYGWYGDLGGGIDRVLRLHRFRHRGHHGRGDQERAARRAARDPDVAGDRHRSLRRGLGRAVRHGFLHPAERRRQAGGHGQSGHRVQRERGDLGQRRSSPSGRWPG